ncbi:MAG: protein-export chaperone SecB [bacterium]|nr:protein-export chaperone SecB [bacterium]
MPPPIECIHHFYPKIIVEANPNFQPPAERLEIKTNYSLQLLQHKEHPLKWQLQLTVTPEAKSKAELPYRIDIQAVGLFEIHSKTKVEDDALASMVYKYGAPMLYASTRELLLGITSRGPWGELRLPTITLGDPDEKAPQKTEKPAKKEPKKPRTKNKSSK